MDEQVKVNLTFKSGATKSVDMTREQAEKAMLAMFRRQGADALSYTCPNINIRLDQVDLFHILKP